jgi:hypothetical protein
VDLPAFAERRNSHPFRSYLTVKFGFFNFVRKWGEFYIAFLKSGGVRAKTNFIKTYRTRALGFFEAQTGKYVRFFWV